MAAAKSERKSAPPGPDSEPPDLRKLRMDYVTTFLSIHDLLQQGTYSGLKGAFKTGGGLPKFRAGLVHLDQVARAFLGRAAGHHRLFERVRDGRESRVVPTNLAQQLAGQLAVVRAQIIRARESARQFAPSGQSVPLVRVGASRTIGLRLLPAILGGWRALFGADMSLEMEIGNTTELVHGLEGERLDFIVSYGSSTPSPVTSSSNLVSGEVPIAFRPFDYPLQLILVCHPNCKLIVRGVNVNPGHRPGRANPRTGVVGLAGVDIDDIDFGATKLIVSKSWWPQPVQLERCISRLKPQGRLQEVRWFQEGLALARMDFGIAVVSEVYMNEPHVSSFALKPEADFTRWIGAYYNAARPMSGQACRLIHFISEYMGAHKKEIRLGKPPSCDEPFLHDWHARDAGCDWNRTAAEQFPPTSVRKK
jgi:hypothetical protein